MRLDNCISRRNVSQPREGDFTDSIDTSRYRAAPKGSHEAHQEKEAGEARNGPPPFSERLIHAEDISVEE